MTKKLPEFDVCTETSKFLKALAHPQRLMLLCLLTEGARTVSELEELSGVSQSSVSQHLNRMRLEGMLESERKSRNVYYRISDERVLKLMNTMYELFCNDI